MSQELRRRIRPRNEVPSNGTTASSNNPPARHSLQWLGLGRWSAAVHVAALMIMISGFIWRASFHSGEECDMTYSMRHFVELDGPQHAVYRLYKFTDRRDPRQQHLYRNPKDNWCTAPVNTTTAIVLYVPGHWGSYSQARSLGAHGLQWTRQHYDPRLLRSQQQDLVQGRWKGQSTNLSSFVYDVYAIDFAEQGGALHANLLYAQSEYVANVVTLLAEKCHNPSITIVGHSIGGLVARSIPILHPHTQIRNIVTLATPHWRLPYGFDETLHDFYKLLDSHEEEATLVSISGGMRDEMIPPCVCYARNNSKTLSILASDIRMPSPGTFGMDHRAIVWCHNLLEKVREVLHLMSVMENASKEQLQSLLQSDDYSKVVATQKKAFRKHFGFFKSTAMESAMLYHIELLLGLYAVTGCVYHTFPSLPVVVVPCFVSVLGVWCTNVEFGVVVILALLANTIHWLVRWILTKMLARSYYKSTKIARVWQLVVVFAVVQLGVTLFGYLWNLTDVRLSLLPAFFVSPILLLPVISLQLRDSRNVTFLSLFLPVLPCLVAGKFYMIAWNIWQEFESMADLRQFLSSVIIPVYLRIFVGDRQGFAPWLPPFLYALALVMYAPWMVQVGGGYVVGYFVACLAWIDVLLFTIAHTHSIFYLG